MSTASDLKLEPAADIASHRFYRPELDCLRFFAFLAVFAFHTFPFDVGRHFTQQGLFSRSIVAVTRAGRFGVDLFFLLSAYLITELLLRERDLYGRVALRSFYVRRILRIWPLYFLALLIGALLPLVDATQRFPAAYVFSFLFLVGNWLTSLRGVPTSVMSPLWSVSFEEQFYLFWPLVIAKMRSARTLAVAATAMLVIAPVARLLLLPYAQDLFQNTFAHLDSLALGIITAVCLHRHVFALSLWARLACLLAGATLWIACGHYFASTRSFVLFGYPAMALGALAIFISFWKADFTPAWLRYLGKISYGLYVFHMLVLHTTANIFGDSLHGPARYALYWCSALALTIAMAALSYRFFESPFLRYKERFARVKSRPA